MIPYEALDLYFALKFHFTSKYDAIKYNFKVKSSPFEKRNELYKYFANRLSKHENPQAVLTSNLVRYPNMFIDKFFTDAGINTYKKWKTYQSAQGYWFKDEFSKCDKTSFVPQPEEHPKALRLYLAKTISPDTLIIADSFIDFIKEWDFAMKGDFAWEQASFLLKKYKPFVKFDREKFKLIIREWYNDVSNAV